MKASPEPTRSTMWVRSYSCDRSSLPFQSRADIRLCDELIDTRSVVAILFALGNLLWKLSQAFSYEEPDTDAQFSMSVIPAITMSQYSINAGITWPADFPYCHRFLR